MVVELDIVEGGKVVTGIVTGMVTGDIVRVKRACLELKVVTDLGEDGVEVGWWKDLCVVVVLDKVRRWWNFGGV